MSKTNLPDGWYKTTLGDISKDVMYGMNVKAIPYDGQHKYIRITDIDENTNKFIPNPLSSPDGEVDKKYKLKNGDILFARTGASVGKSYLFNEQDGDLYFAGFLIKLNIIKNNAAFIYFQTQSSSYWNWVKSVSMRSGQPGINAEELKKLPIIIAPLEEQKAIADTLQTWDTAIEKTEELIAAKEKQFGWLADQLTGIKENYPIKFLGELCQCYQPKTISKNVISKDGLYKVYGANGVIGFHDSYNHEEEQVALTCRGSTCGCVNFTDKKSYITGNAMILKPRNSDVDKKFLYYYLLRANFNFFITGMAQPQITRGAIERMSIPLPSLPEQKRIAEILNTAQREINILKQLADQYRAQKRGLMQKLLTGKWRLKI